jgi:hypothetical protein
MMERMLGRGRWSCLALVGCAVLSSACAKTSDKSSDKADDDPKKPASVPGEPGTDDADTAQEPASNPLGDSDGGFAIAPISGPLTGEVEIAPENMNQYALCGTMPAQVDFDIVGEASMSLAEYPDGDIDLPLTPDGCIRYLRHVEDGVITSSAFIRYITVNVDLGDLASLDPEMIDPAMLGASFEQIRYVAEYSTLARWELIDGVMVGTIGAKNDVIYAPDDFREIETRESHGKFEMTIRDDAADNVVWRRTVESHFGEDEEEWTETISEEDFADEAFTTTSHASAATAAESARKRKCVADAKPCSKAQVERLEKDFALALEQGSKCLKDYDMDSLKLRLLELLGQAWAKKHAWRCMPSGCNFVLGRGFSATDQYITLDYDYYTSRQDPSGAVMFHEMMHALVGKHNSELIDELLDDAERRTEPSSPRAQKLTTVDRTYACQALCFDDVQTRCSCASCLDTTVCDKRCKELAECTGATCDMATGCKREVSEALTVCEKSAADGSHSYDWFLSPDLCSMSGCESGATPGKCTKYGRECPIEE